METIATLVVNVLREPFNVINVKNWDISAKVCRSSDNSVSTKSSAALFDPILATVSAGTPSCLSNAVKELKINGYTMTALIDTGSSENFISKNIVDKLQIPYTKHIGCVSMASSALKTEIHGSFTAEIELVGKHYKNKSMLVLSDLCADVIIGQSFMKEHSSITLTFGGDLPPLSICALGPSSISPPTLFTNLSNDCHPIATPSRRFSQVDRQFIDSEIQKLLKDGIIEPSNSPWRAQVVVTTNERHKKRLCIDYSQTINKFTYLDAYPLPRIDNQINEISKYHFFSTLDLKSAYHQIPLLLSDKPYTAFEANGKLYQFARLPFGPTNAVAAFQRKIDDFIADNNLKDTFAYMDNITVAGMTQQEHDMNLKNL